MCNCGKNKKIKSTSKTPKLNAFKKTNTGKVNNLGVKLNVKKPLVRKVTNNAVTTNKNIVKKAFTIKKTG